ncbi:type II toxin-antitoxin system Phd/YefM family antitoxin [Cupriavidus necator]
MLLDRADQAITATDLQRKGKALMDRLEAGDQDRYVIMRDNRPAAVLMPVQRYEQMMAELEDLRIDAIARERLTNFDRTQAISHQDMLKRFGEPA